MTNAARVITSIGGLRRKADFTPDQAEAIGVATAEVAEAAADRIADHMIIR